MQLLPYWHSLVKAIRSLSLQGNAEVRVNVSAVTLLLGTISNFARKTDISNLRSLLQIEITDTLAFKMGKYSEE